VDRFLGKEVFAREVKRVLRSQSFDYIYNLAFDDLQYKLFIPHLTGKKTLINSDNYLSKDPRYLEALRQNSEYLDLYDEIWFENGAKLAAAKQFSPKIIGKKGKLVPHFDAVTGLKSFGLIGKTFKQGDAEYMIADFFNGEYLDTMSLDSVLLPKEKYPYIVLPQISEEKKDLLLNQIRQLLKDNKTLYIFDIHRIMTDNDRADLKNYGVLVMHESYTALNMLIPYLGDRIHIDDAYSANQSALFKGLCKKEYSRDYM
jgi:hypothetical protein